MHHFDKYDDSVSGFNKREQIMMLQLSLLLADLIYSNQIVSKQLKIHSIVRHFNVESQDPIHWVGLEGLLVCQNQTVNAISDPEEGDKRLN